MKDIKNLILKEVHDKAIALVYYDRKEDEDLPSFSIEKAIESGIISIDDIVEAFRINVTEFIRR